MSGAEHEESPEDLEEATDEVVSLESAVSSGDLERMRKQLDKSPELLQKFPQVFFTCYFIGIKMQSKPICSHLIQRKFHQNEAQILEAEKLGDLVRRGHAEKLSGKLNPGNCNLRDWKCRTPIMWAAIGNKSFIKGDQDCLELLMKAGADVTAADLDGNTALHLASAANNLPVIDALIDAGASLYVRNYREATPLMEAERLGHGTAQNRLRVSMGLPEVECSQLSRDGPSGAHSSDSEGWEAFSNTSNSRSVSKISDRGLGQEKLWDASDHQTRLVQSSCFQQVPLNVPSRPVQSAPARSMQ